MFGRLFKKGNEFDKSYLRQIENFCYSFGTTLTEAEKKVARKAWRGLPVFLQARKLVGNSYKFSLLPGMTEKPKSVG